MNNKVMYERIREYHEKQIREGRVISLPQAIAEWFTSADAEEYRKEVIRKQRETN